MKGIGYAIRLAAEVHDGQVDKSGVDYILHCIAVMELVGQRSYWHNPHYRELAMIAAVLHDTYEDHQGDEDARGLFQRHVYESFGYQVDKTVEALTHRPNESYEDYIERVAANQIARVVKIADLTHNMDPRRIPADQIVDKDFKRWDKYRRALIRLERE